MKLRELIELTLGEAVEDDYVRLGIAPDRARVYLGARVPLGVAKSYDDVALKHQMSAEEGVQNYKSMLRRKREDHDYNRLVASLPELAAQSGPLTHDQACACIANNDDLFWLIANYTSDPDHLENALNQTQDLIQIIQRIKPFRVSSPLYRGECAYSERDAHKRGLHSWTRARDTAEYFYRDCGRDRGRLLQLSVPIRGVSFANIGAWRMRLRQGESHYLAAQDEWLIPDGYPVKIVAET